MTWRRAELAALVVFAVALPLFEAPKNIFWFLYLFAWIGNRAQAGSHGGPWRAWDTLVAAVLASAGLGAVLAGLHGGEWIGARLEYVGEQLLLLDRLERDLANFETAVLDGRG